MRSRRPAPQAGWRSYSSGRAVQTSSSGTPCAQSARCSRNASSASSAQWTSSNTSTAGPSLGHRLEEPPPGGERLLLRGRLARVDPDQRQQPRPQPRPRRRPRAATALELRGGVVRRVGLEDPGVRLDDLAQRPERDPLAVGQAAALPPADELRPRRRHARTSSATRRLLPTPGSPAIVTSCTERSATALLERPATRRELELAADERRRHRADHVRCRTGARAASARQTRYRLRLALRRDRLQRLVLEDALGRPERLLSDRDAVDRCRAWIRAAVLTTSPVTIPSPSSGPRASATTASPGVDADAHRQRRATGSARSARRSPRGRARPARTARSASSSCATGAPKTAITASPTNFSTVPP